MASQGLSREQCLLLQRHHDGELSAAENVEAQQLLERSASARVFVRALDELSHAVRAASDVAWQDAKQAMPSSAVLAELAFSAGDLAQAPLEELAPLLERFHDGEADQAEMAFVSAMLDEREDAVDYLASLDEIGLGMRVVGEEMAEDVDFGGFWDGIAAQIGADETTVESTPKVDFDPREHLVLLHRYADGEVDAEETNLVEAWVEGGEQEVKDYLEVLSELSLGVNAAVDTACEDADLRSIWTGVQEAIEASDDASVVSLSDRRAEKRDRSSDPGRDADQNHGGAGWFGEYRQAIVGALAAAVVLAGLVGLFKDQIFGPQERVIVEKRVVIVEQVEYSPGSDVMIDSPMKQVSADSEGEEDPTVIWLFDSEEPADGEAPAEQEEDAGGFDQDAGQKSAPKGQPI